MSSLPLNAIIANALAGLSWAALTLLDRMNEGCGDGLCSFFSGAILIGGLALATLIFALRSARRSETPAILQLTPFLIWAGVLAPALL